MFFPIPLEFKGVETKSRFPAANAALVAVNVLVYLLGWYWPAGPGTGPLSVLMYGFCHFGFWHLVLNMWVLWVFGNPVNRRLGNALYLMVYLGCLLAIGVFARIILPVGLVGASGAIFAVITIALILMPAAVVESAYLAMFPLTLLLGLFQRPKYELNWFLSWGIVAVPAWWCLVLIPLMELFSIFWRVFSFGWISCWTPGAHLLGILCGVAVVLMLPARVTRRQSLAGI
jgi:membrane associated rhomboid family serine protease